jgi:hypothetical protein
MEALLFSLVSRHAGRAGPFLHLRLCWPSDRFGWRDWKFAKMRQLRKLLRAAPSRIGRRLAQIVAIAAASLPAAGA